MQGRYLKKHEKHIQGICKAYLKMERDSYAGHIKTQIEKHMQGISKNGTRCICRAYSKTDLESYAGHIQGI